MPHILKREDVDFLLHDLLKVEDLTETERFSGQNRELYDQIVETAEKLAENIFQPAAAKVDANEPEFDGEQVHIIDETQKAVDAFVDAGFTATVFDEDLGGMQLPFTVMQASMAFLHGATTSLAGYGMLTVGAANLLSSYATEEQTEKFLKPMIEGRFFGTMCLSEPQAGSSLADIRTKAVPQDDGTYRVSGNKMWISGGEHTLSDNIIHLVLAKLPDAPAGVKGISLFIVPRVMVNDDGSLGERNDVRLAGLNHKMGQRGIVNTALNFGEKDGAVGYLVGEPHKGLAYMFHMMNEARIGVGLSAAAMAYTGYLHSLDYAKNRPQGRPVEAKDPTAPMVPIIQHADVKRMLLKQKAYAEGALALCFYAARLIDEEKTGDQTQAQDANLVLEILTPIVKSWTAEYGLKANELSMQVLGGYGYTRDYPLERIYRDNRLNPIHEGTKGIQGQDLLGRKVTMAQGAAVQRLRERIDATINEALDVSDLSSHAMALRDTWDKITETTQTMLGQAGSKGAAAMLANASIYLDNFGQAVVGWLWLKQAVLAEELMTHNDPRHDFLKGKMQACDYFFRYELPGVATQMDFLAKLDTTCLDTEESWF